MSCNPKGTQSLDVNKTNEGIRVGFVRTYTNLDLNKYLSGKSLLRGTTDDSSLAPVRPLQLRVIDT